MREPITLRLQDFFFVNLNIGEGFAGSLLWKELVDICKKVGFSGPYLVSRNSIVAENKEHKKVLGVYKYRKFSFIEKVVVFWYICAHRQRFVLIFLRFSSKYGNKMI